MLKMIFRFLFCSILVNFAFGQSWEKCDDHQKCISETLCGADGKVKTDGSGMLGTRGNVIKACGTNQVCCQFEIPMAGNLLEDFFTIPKCGLKGTDTKPRTQSRILVDLADDIEEQEAIPSEFPWMILVLKKQKNGLHARHCGGSLIRADVVLTSAHNVKKEVETDLMVRAGEWDILSTDELLKSVDKQVFTLIMHEDFEANTVANDVALLILEHSFELTPHINVICLPVQDFNFDGKTCTVTGWGKSEFGPNGKEQSVLKKIDLPMISFDKCNEMLKQTHLGDTFDLNKSFNCAGGELGKDACTGDGGSPLFCQISNRSDEYYQAGIVSWGIGCGQANVPGVYADVAQFVDWIEKTIKENEIREP